MTPARPPATGTERPIFLDETGRRARRVRAIGAVAGAAAMLWLGAIVGGPVGFERLPPGPLAARPLAPPATLLPRAHRTRTAVLRARRERRERRT